MVFTKALALKVLGGVTACASVIYAGIKIDEKLNSEITPEKLIKKAGLSCGDVNNVAATGNECSILTEPEGTKLNVKQGQTTFEMTTLTETGKIKLYKLEDDNTDYNKNLKFVIEGGDITKETHTLEQFETYEITEETVDNNKKYYLTRKTTSFEHKRKLLGIPNKCNVVEESADKSCDLSGNELKEINFDGKSGDPTVTDTKLKITTTTDKEIFTEEGYKFTLISSSDIVVPQTGNPSSYTLKANTNTEFKIKKESSTKWTLEKAWDVSKLAAKVGLENCVKATDDSSNNECTFKTDAKINLFNSDDDKVVKASITPPSSGGQTKMKYFENEKNYNQGIKFQALSDITLTGGTPGSEDKKIESFGSNTSYQIMKKEGNWYLVKIPAGTPP